MKKARFLIGFGLALAALGALAEGRSLTCLSGADWTLDGAPVSVPHTWNVEDGADGPDPNFTEPWDHDSVAGHGFRRQRAVYAHALPAARPGRRYFVRVDGASVRADVAVNGQPVATHLGAYTGFTCEVTALLKADAPSELAIAVDNRFDPDVPPICGDFTPFGGLYRDVWLVETPDTCIDPTYFGGPGVQVTAEADGRLQARVHVLGEAADVVCRLVETGLEFAPGETVTCAGVEPWSPENPRLYHLKVTVGEDALVVPFGFRTAEFRDDRFYLNGTRRQLRGVCAHQDFAGKGSAVSPDEEALSMAWIKRLGADAIRTSHYPRSPEFYRLADEQGVMVWTEIPLVDRTTDSPAFVSNVVQAAREMVAQHANHPSVVMWGLFNELYYNHQPAEACARPVAAAEQAIRALDPSRPTVAALCHRDQKEINSVPEEIGGNFYPGWYGFDANDLGNVIHDWCLANAHQALSVSEYGAGASLVQHENPAVKPPVPESHWHPEEWQTWHHVKSYPHIRGNDEVWGSFVWVMFDLASDSRAQGDHDGMNDKGLVTYDRKTAKDAFYYYKANWNLEPMLHLCGSRMTETASPAVDVLAFSNVGAVTLRVNGQTLSTVEPDDFRVVAWKGVALKPGKNVLEVTAGSYCQRVTWTRTQAEASAE